MPNIPIPLQLEGLLAKVETTYGTDASPVVGTDGVRISTHFWNILRPSYAWENLRPDAVTGTVFQPTPAIPRGSMASLDILCEVKGPGVAYSSSIKPEVDPLLQACGWNSVGSFGGGTEKYTYTLLNNLHKSCTIYGYGAGMVVKLFGCRGSMRWTMQAGVLNAMRFQMMGILSSVSQLVLPTVTSYDTTAPVAGVNLGVTVGSYSPDVTTVEFDQGSNVQRFDSGNATDGISLFDWMTADPVVTMTVRAPDDGTGRWDTTNFNPFADATARTSRSLATTAGSSQYNRGKINIASMYNVMPDPAADQDAAAVNLRYVVTDSAMTLVYD